MAFNGSQNPDPYHGQPRKDAPRPDRRWSRDQKIAVVGLFVALIALVVAVVPSELRQALHLERPDPIPGGAIEIEVQDRLDHGAIREAVSLRVGDTTQTLKVDKDTTFSIAALGLPALGTYDYELTVNPTFDNIERGQETTLTGLTRGRIAVRNGTVLKIKGRRKNRDGVPVYDVWIDSDN